MCECGGRQVRAALRALQAAYKGEYLRQSWCNYHNGQLVESYMDEWAQARSILEAPADLGSRASKEASLQCSVNKQEERAAQ